MGVYCGPPDTGGAVKNIYRAGLLGIATGFLAVSGTGAAMAAYYESAKKHYTVNGHSYYNEAVIYDSGQGQTIQVHHSGNAPTSWMGVKGRVYWDGGTLCNTSVWRYNSSGPDYWLDVTFASGCGGYIYSKGQTKAWNGSDYPIRSTERTINVFT